MHVFASACSRYFVLVCDSPVFYNSTNQWEAGGRIFFSETVYSLMEKWLGFYHSETLLYTSKAVYYI